MKAIKKQSKPQARGRSLHPVVRHKIKTGPSGHLCKVCGRLMPTNYPEPVCIRCHIEF